MSSDNVTELVENSTELQDTGKVENDENKNISSGKNVIIPRSLPFHSIKKRRCRPPKKTDDSRKYYCDRKNLLSYQELFVIAILSSFCTVKIRQPKKRSYFSLNFFEIDSIIYDGELIFLNWLIVARVNAMKETQTLPRCTWTEIRQLESISLMIEVLDCFNVKVSKKDYHINMTKNEQMTIASKVKIKGMKSTNLDESLDYLKEFHDELLKNMENRDSYVLTNDYLVNLK